MDTKELHFSLIRKLVKTLLTPAQHRKYSWCNFPNFFKPSPDPARLGSFQGPQLISGHFKVLNKYDFLNIDVANLDKTAKVRGAKFCPKFSSKVVRNADLCIRNWMLEIYMSPISNSPKFLVTNVLWPVFVVQVHLYQLACNHNAMTTH